MTGHSIAIDGPSGAGKSTLAKRLAEELGFLYVDTGAIYRTVGLCAWEHGADPEKADQVIPLLDSIQIDLHYGADGLQRMFLNGRDVTEDIRRHEISRCASGVSAIPAVRAFLLNMQRRLAAEHSVVMDGRDIGTVVLPNAEVKIFLTADPADRAQRRYQELLARGQQAEYETVLRDLLQRDEHDTNRTAAPLRQAEDAILVDTTGLTLEESFQAVLHVVKERLIL